jgi:hypothetical protein
VAAANTPRKASGAKAGGGAAALTTTLP